MTSMHSQQETFIPAAYAGSLAVENGRTPALLPNVPAMWRRALLAWILMTAVMSLDGVLRVKPLAA